MGAFNTIFKYIWQTKGMGSMRGMQMQRAMPGMMMNNQMDAPMNQRMLRMQDKMPGMPEQGMMEGGMMMTSTTTAPATR